MLEQGVVGQLAGRMDVRGWGELRRHVEAQYKAVDDKNDALADALGSGFHEVLVKLSGNRVVQEMHAQLIRRTALMRALVSSRFDYCGLLHDHDALVDLLEAGKVTEAQQLIDTHHRSVVRGYVLDENIEPIMTPREALEPYVEDVQQQKIVTS
jgi:DNA-binding GntR family transcriptional regulator